MYIFTLIYNKRPKYKKQIQIVKPIPRKLFQNID